MSSMLVAPLLVKKGGEVDLSQDLVAHYTMDNISGSTLIDEVGNFDGIISGAVTTAGQDGNALSFDGSNDFTDLLTTTGFNFIHNSAIFTISTWAAKDSGTNSTIIGSSPNSKDKGFRLRYSDTSDLSFEIKRGVIGEHVALVSAVNVIPDTDFHHICVRGNGDYVYLYVDAALVATAAVGSTVLGDAVYSPYIGACNYSSFNTPLDGSVDHIRIYNADQGANGVLALYYEVA